MTPTKFCTKCGEYKTRPMFGRNSKAVDGLQGYCKECVSAYNRERYQAKKAEKDRAARAAADVRKLARTTQHAPVGPTPTQPAPKAPAAVQAPASPQIQAPVPERPIVKPPWREHELDFIEDYWDWPDEQIAFHLARRPAQIADARAYELAG